MRLVDQTARSNGTIRATSFLQWPNRTKVNRLNFDCALGANGSEYTKMINELPIIDSCDNCSACCMEQESPPGYAMLLSSTEMREKADLLEEDVQRLRSLPPAALEELHEYLRQLLAGVTRSTRACIWLDQTTMRCRHHEHRPMICREFEVGSDECRGWRIAYGIDQ